MGTYYKSEKNFVSLRAMNRNLTPNPLLENEREHFCKSRLQAGSFVKKMAWNLFILNQLLYFDQSTQEVRLT